MKKFFKTLKIVLPVLVLYFIFRINLILGLALLVAAIFILAIVYRYLIYYVKASKLYNSGNLDEAIKYFKKTYEVRNCSDNLRISYGFILLKSERLQEAEEVLNKLMKKKMDTNDKYNVKMNYALVKWKMGELDKAISILWEVYDNFKNTTIYENLGYLLILDGQYEEALKMNKEGYEYNNGSKVIADNLGETYYYLGEYEEADNIYKEILEKNPEFLDALYYHGLVLNKLDKKEEALEKLNKALELKESTLSDVNHEKIRNAIKEIENS